MCKNARNESFGFFPSPADDLRRNPSAGPERAGNVPVDMMMTMMKQAKERKKIGRDVVHHSGLKRVFVSMAVSCLRAKRIILDVSGFFVTIFNKKNETNDV
jgi:hypothetical protein